MCEKCPILSGDMEEINLRAMIAASKPKIIKKQC
jgi:hypothetical protein